MEVDTALLVLAWLGKVIAARLAGSTAEIAWKQLRPAFERLLRSALNWKIAAEEHAQVIKQHEQAAARIEEATKDLQSLVEVAARKLEEMQEKVARLEQDKAELLEQLSKRPPSPTDSKT